MRRKECRSLSDFCHVEDDVAALDFWLGMLTLYTQVHVGARSGRLSTTITE